MRYLTAIEAAKRIGVAEKTVRLWVKEGKLDAHHPAKNRLAIAESDVERLAQERRLYYNTQPDMPSSNSTQPDISVLEARVRELEQKVTSLEQTIHTLTHPVTSSQAPEKTEKLYKYAVDKSDVQPPQSTQKRATIANITIPNDIPQGSLLFSDFAARHQVNRATFHRHCTSGIQGDRVETIEKPKPGGRVGDKERILNKSQQGAAIEFWKRHNVLFSLCEDDFCDCHG